MLTAAELDTLAGFAAGQLDPQLGGCIPGKAVQEDARGGLLHRDSRFGLERLDAREGHRLQLARRRGREACGLPRTVVEAGTVPAQPLRARIEILARIDVREHDRSLRRAPSLVGADAIATAPGGFTANLGAEQERLVGLPLGAVFIVTALGRIGVVPEGVAEHDPHAIGPLPYQG